MTAEVPEGPPRIGMLGGTFDPPHLAHLALAEAARDQLHLDRVVFVPAGDPWRKRDHDVSPAEARLAMLRAAVEPLPWATISTVEIDRSGPSYTADTLTELVMPGEQWWFIVGADALADMSHWHEPERIIDLARLAVAARAGDRPELDDALRGAMPGIEDRIDFIEMAPMRVSSTDIRQRIREGRHTEGSLPSGVRIVAETLRLYRQAADEPAEPAR